MEKLLEHPFINKSGIAGALIPKSDNPFMALFARKKRGRMLTGTEQDNNFLSDARELRDILNEILQEQSIVARGKIEIIE